MTAHSPAPRPDGTRIALIAGIALSALLLVGVGVTALVLALGGSGGSSDDDAGPDPTAGSESPEDALRAFVEATNAGDCEVLVQHPITDLDSVEDCEDALDDAREDAEDSGYDYDAFAFEIDDLDVTSEDDATVTIAVDATQTYELDGDEESYDSELEYELEKDGDSWIVVELLDEDVEEPSSVDEA